LRRSGTIISTAASQYLLFETVLLAGLALGVAAQKYLVSSALRSTRCFLISAGSLHSPELVLAG